MPIVNTKYNFTVLNSKGDAENLTLKVVGINKIRATVMSNDQNLVVLGHIKAIEWYASFLRLNADIRNFFNNNRESFQELYQMQFQNLDEEKINKEIENINENIAEKFNGSLSILPENCDKKFSDLVSNEQIKKMFQQFFDDFCTLTIITKGAPQNGVTPELKTEIKISGDITSQTNLTGADLLSYHERMQTVSVNLIKTYIQVIIQIVGLLLPFSGITQITAESLKNVNDLIKSFITAPS
jgi:hypothetical protein